MNLPDFLIVGAMKAGTTTLYRDLLTNPAVCLPLRKEPNALCSDAVLEPEGIEAYAELFEGKKPGQICGEASTAYTKLPVFSGVTQRALAVLGEKLKIIYIVREPISRIISHHHHALANGQVGDDINQAVRAMPELLDFTRYAMQISPWIETFGREQVLLMRFEDFTADRLEAARTICSFLGIEPQPDLIRTDAVFNKGENKPLGTGLWQTIVRTKAYRKMVRPILPLTIKDRLRELALPKAPPRPDPPQAETVAFILDALAEDLDTLRRLMDRDKPVWPDVLPQTDSARNGKQL